MTTGEKTFLGSMLNLGAERINNIHVIKEKKMELMRGQTFFITAVELIKIADNFTATDIEGKLLECGVTDNALAIVKKIIDIDYSYTNDITNGDWDKIQPNSAWVK